MELKLARITEVKLGSAITILFEMDEKDLMLIESIVNEYLETDFEWLKSQATIDSLIDLKDRLEDQTDILTKEMDEIALELNHYFSQIYGP